MSEHVKGFFAHPLELDSFRRIDDTHPVDLYLGKDHLSRYTLLLISDGEPIQINSSQLILIQIGCRDDGRWAVSFSLIDDKLVDLFCHFCGDIIDSSRPLKDMAQATAYVCNRYKKWQEMLEKNLLGLMSFSEIKGLIGELYFLKEYMFKRFGMTKALESWIGPAGADQDFILDDHWYEVKAIVSGAESVSISSVEQLDSSDVGDLILVYLDKTSYADSKRITLNALINEIRMMFTNPSQNERFSDILLDQGYYYREEYDEYIFRFSGMNRYYIDATFPALRRKDIPEAIVNAKYALSVSAIHKCLREGG